MLVSIVLVSNRPSNIAGLFQNILDTADDPSRVEVLVKIDDGDESMRQCVADEAARRPFRIVVLTGPRPESHFHLWKSLNDLHDLVDPTAYFVCNFNDEVRFLSSGWDSVLARHQGLFPDHIFRLRTSRWKLRSYVDLWECWYAPENYGFYTKRWIDIQGGWNACHVSDSFQQCVAFYLALTTYPDADQHCRDVPIWGVELGGQEAAANLEGTALAARNLGNDRAWYRIMSVEMQTEIFRRARLLQAHISLGYERSRRCRFKDDPTHRLISVHDEDGHCIIVYSYRVDEWRIRFDNLVERLKGRLFHHRSRYARLNRLKFFRGQPEKRNPGRVFHTTRWSIGWRSRLGRWTQMLTPTERASAPKPLETLPCFGAAAPAQPLISFHLASMHPSKLQILFDSIERTVGDPGNLELLIKIDREDAATRAYLAAQCRQRSFSIRYIATPRGEGYFGLWRAYNDLLRHCAPNAYFVSLINDEIIFKTPHWDRLLLKYKGFFPDDVFRLRISAYKLHNYTDFWECGFAPDAYAIYTKKWFDVSGDWNRCNTPDSFQQTVAFRLWRATFPSPGNRQYSRDVPIWDITLSGEAPYQGLTSAELDFRVRRAEQDWYNLMSPKIQEETNHRAHRLLNHIWAVENGIDGFSIETDRKTKRVEVVDAVGRIVRRTRYKLNPWPIRITNFLRAPLFDLYCGGDLETLVFVKAHARGKMRERLSRATSTRERFGIVARYLWKFASQNLLFAWLRLSGGYSPKDFPWKPATVAPAATHLEGVWDAATREAGSIAVATDWIEPHRPQCLLDGTDEPWGSQETSEDTMIHLVRENSLNIRGIDLVLFSPNNRSHMCEVAVIGGRVENGRLQSWTIIPSRLSEAEPYQEKLTIPEGCDKDVVPIQLLSQDGLERFNAYGIACLSGSRGYRRNHLPVGRGIYLRAMALR